MTREEVEEKLLTVNNKVMLLALPTSFGKSKIGLDLCFSHNPSSILIVVPRLVLIDNWIKEFKKWGRDLDKVTFSTYAGLHKAIGNYSVVILDEAHHITERVQDILQEIHSTYTIMLSATVKRELVCTLKSMYPDLYYFKVSTKQAIDNNILPDPKVYLLPLFLDNSHYTETIEKHPKGKKTITCNYNERWKYLKDPSIHLIIKCTPKQKYEALESELEFWKRRYMSSRNDIFKNKWLQLATKRLKYLSNLKNNTILEILKYLSSQRVLTFCNSIEQTELLGKYCVNSKNKGSEDIIQAFNMHKIKHITACDMLNEGINLTDCKIGIFARLNSSEILIKQKLGRLLRHESPVLIIPYYKYTREEEIKDKMLEDYNPSLVETILTIKDIKL